MYVQSLHWIDPDTMEAEVEITDGEYTIKCFSHPCHYAVGQKLEDQLECCDVSSVVRETKRMLSVQKQAEPFSYFLCGEVISCDGGNVRIGKLFMHIDAKDLPGDISDGDYVSFSTSRVDVW